MPWIVPGLGEIIFVVAPACSRAFFGSVSSTCSKSVVTIMATRMPFNVLPCIYFPSSTPEFTDVTCNLPHPVSVDYRMSSFSSNVKGYIEYTYWLAVWRQELFYQFGKEQPGSGGSNSNIVQTIIVFFFFEQLTQAA